jgi:threonine dehydratase
MHYNPVKSFYQLPFRRYPGSRKGVATFPALQRYIDQLVLVSEEENADAILLLLERKHIVAEGAGAVPSRLS